MNRLALCQRAAIECGVASNTAILTALPTTIGATGSLGRIVNWIDTAWCEVQSSRSDWDFMRSSNILGAGVSFQTIAGQFSYPLGIGPGTVGVAVDDFGKWATETIWSYTTAAGYADEINLEEIPFDAWRVAYMSSGNRDNRSRPAVFAVGPDESLNLGPNVTGTYTITGDYFVAPTVMTMDADVPIGLPVRYHMLLVAKVMMMCGQFESANELYSRGSELNLRMYTQLLAARTPRISWGVGALA